MNFLKLKDCCIHNPFVSSVISTIAGGILLALILFIFNEYISPKKNLIGEWDLVLSVEDSAYNPYKGLEMEYKLHLMQVDNAISGSGEKVAEIQAGKRKDYEPQKRNIIQIEGYYERKYLGKSKVYLCLCEQGALRPSTTTVIMTFNSKNEMEGISLSTAANTKGKVLMTR